MSAYWLSYDFSSPENFDGFYKWLASLPAPAKECGFYTVLIDFDGDISELKKILSKTVKGISSERVYVIRKKENKAVGSFLFGKRRVRNPWDIYLEVEAEEDE